MASFLFCMAFSAFPFVSHVLLNFHCRNGTVFLMSLQSEKGWIWYNLHYDYNRTEESCESVCCQVVWQGVRKGSGRGSDPNGGVGVVEVFEYAIMRGMRALSTPDAACKSRVHCRRRYRES